QPGRDHLQDRPRCHGCAGTVRGSREHVERVGARGLTAASAPSAPQRTSRVFALVVATHPLPCLAVTALVTALAISADVGGRSALLAVAVLCGQLSVGWSNDAIDAPLDTRAARRDKPIANGAVSRNTVAWCAGV